MVRLQISGSVLIGDRREGGNVTRDAEIGVMGSQVKKYLEPPEARKRQGKNSFQDTLEEHSSRFLNFEPPE